MIRTRHRLLALLASVVVLGVAVPAFAQEVILGQGNNAVVATLGTVHIGTGGLIDVGQGALIVTTSDFGYMPPTTGVANEIFTGGTAAEYGDAAIHDALVFGANAATGYWNGTSGITSSVAAGSLGPGQVAAAVGWVDNSVTKYTSFEGVAVNPSESIISYTYVGDANLDGIVDVGNDLAAWSGVFNGGATAIPGEINWADGDFNGDGIVDVGNDLAAWSGVFNTNPAPLPFNVNAPLAGYSTASASGGTPVAVPEPGSLALLGLAALCGLVCTRLRRPRRARTSGFPA